MTSVIEIIFRNKGLLSIFYGYGFIRTWEETAGANKKNTSHKCTAAWTDFQYGSLLLTVMWCHLYVSKEIQNSPLIQNTVMFWNPALNFHDRERGGKRPSELLQIILGSSEKLAW